MSRYNGIHMCITVYVRKVKFNKKREFKRFCV